MKRFDIAIVGGGLVGAAIAFGMRDLGPRLAVLDEGDVALRAARGNFGLIWVQGKGAGMAPYGSWTQRSAREWPEFARRVRDATDVDVALRQGGGVHVCLSRPEMDVRAEAFRALFAQPGFPRYDVEFLDRAGLASRVSHLGPEVVGGTWSALDGDCNPLRLMRGLHAALARAGANYLPRHRVDAIEPAAWGFTLRTEQGPIECGRIVLAAGLANARLAPQIGISAPVRPNKGQVIVLERLQPFLPLPVETIRQTDDGTVMIGDSQQERGQDDTLDTAVLAAMARRAVRVFPRLADCRVHRAWAALRVMSPDGFPIYAQSRLHAGAFVVSCHSGVTLAAAHACLLAPALRDGALPPELQPFAAERFDVRAAA